MAEVKIEDVVDHLDTEFRKALADTIKQIAPDLVFDERAAFRLFKRRIYSRCSVWETVPDDLVKAR
jgi:hypothetical protein